MVTWILALRSRSNLDIFSRRERIYLREKTIGEFPLSRAKHRLNFFLQIVHPVEIH